MIDFTLYLLFFFPGVSALIYSGFIFARQSWRYGETSVYSPAQIPIYQLKALIPVAGVVLFLQGISELVALHPLHPGRLLAGALSRRRGARDRRSCITTRTRSP